MDFLLYLDEYMRRVLFIGDVHGDFQTYFDIVNSIECAYSIQLGDMEIGLPETKKRYNSYFPIDLIHNFIRGNHDYPELCRNHSHYLGEYGINEDGIFYVSGAFSINKDYLQPYVNWWPNEELNEGQFENVLELYEKEKPDIIASHSPPTELLEITSFSNTVINSRTSDMFSKMLKIHRPKKWIFAHMHNRVIEKIDGTEFICLDVLDHYLLEI